MSALTEDDNALDAAIARAFMRGPAELVDELTDAEYEQLSNSIRREVLRAIDKMTPMGEPSNDRRTGTCRTPPPRA